MKYIFYIKIMKISQKIDFQEDDITKIINSMTKLQNNKTLNIC